MDLSLTVLSFMLTNVMGDLILSHKDWDMALQFAPESNKAYDGVLAPPACTKTGTIGLVAPAPPYAARSHASSE